MRTRRRRLVFMAPDKECIITLVTVIVLWNLVAHSAYKQEDPIFLVPTPITRRNNPYSLPYEAESGCGYALNLGSWTESPIRLHGESCSQQDKYATCSSHAERRWAWHPQAINCGAKYMDSEAATNLLAGKTIAFVGDSTARGLAAGLMRLLRAPPSAFVYQRHADFNRVLGLNTTVNFYWKPFISNATDLITSWKASTTPTSPPADVVVFTNQLWHLLYMSNATQYGEEIHGFSKTITSWLAKATPRPLLLATSGTETFSNKLRTMAKRKNMTTAEVDGYNTALIEQQILAPKGPFGLLDMFKLTWGCGEECSTDGIHSVDTVYDAAIQIALRMYERCSGDKKSMTGCYL